MIPRYLRPRELCADWRDSRSGIGRAAKAGRREWRVKRYVVSEREIPQRVCAVNAVMEYCVLIETDEIREDSDCCRSCSNRQRARRTAVGRTSAIFEVNAGARAVRIDRPVELNSITPKVTSRECGCCGRRGAHGQANVIDPERCRESCICARAEIKADCFAGKG